MKVLGARHCHCAACCPRSYMVTTPDGTVSRRNRRQVLSTNKTPPVIAGQLDGWHVTPSIVSEHAVTVASIGFLSPNYSLNQCSPQQTYPNYSTSSGRTVRLTARFREDYVTN